MKLKRRVYEVLETGKPGDKASRAFDMFKLGKGTSMTEGSPSGGPWVI